MPWVYQRIVLYDEHGKRASSGFQVNWTPVLRVLIVAMMYLMVLQPFAAYLAGGGIHYVVALGFWVVGFWVICGLFQLLEAGRHAAFEVPLMNAAAFKDVHEKAVAILQAHWALQYRVPLLGSRLNMWRVGKGNNDRYQAALHTRAAIKQLVALKTRQDGGDPTAYTFYQDNFFDQSAREALGHVKAMHKPYYRSLKWIEWPVQQLHIVRHRGYEPVRVLVHGSIVADGARVGFHLTGA